MKLLPWPKSPEKSGETPKRKLARAERHGNRVAQLPRHHKWWIR